jgi:hypothetical protein
MVRSRPDPRDDESIVEASELSAACCAHSAADEGNVDSIERSAAREVTRIEEDCRIWGIVKEAFGSTPSTSHR